MGNTIHWCTYDHLEYHVNISNLLIMLPNFNIFLPGVHHRPTYCILAHTTCIMYTIGFCVMFSLFMFRFCGKYSWRFNDFFSMKFSVVFPCTQQHNHCGEECFCFGLVRWSWCFLCCLQSFLNAYFTRYLA